MTNPIARAPLAAAAIAAAIALAGCNADDITPTGRAMAQLSPQMVALIKSKNMDKDSPILIRVFKDESELEVWKQNREGQYALLKTYPICRWSGDLGPKKKQGDRQAPEGFYTITPGQMNPNSNYYLAFNTGYPNAYDRAWGRTGTELMVHGDCSSRGCYAMTDKQILEIYALGRDAFWGGQKEFQFQAFPFRMTALNMAKHRNNPNFAFWKMLKQGYDDFEATHQEPKIAVCEKRYVFDAAPPEGLKGPLHFSPSGKCPAYQLDPAVASVITDYRRQQEIKMANYIARGVAVAPPHQSDGGMNPTFEAELAMTNVKLQPRMALPRVPGALPRVPNPPGTTIPKVGVALVQNETAPASAPALASEPQPQSQPIVTASVPMPEPAPLPTEGQPVPEKKSTSIASLLGKLFGRHKVQAARAPTETANADSNAPVTVHGTNTEMAATPKQTPTVRTAATPIKQPSEAHKPTALAKSEPAMSANKAVAKAEPTQTAVVAQDKAQSPWPTAQKNPVVAAPKIHTASSTPPESNSGLLAGAQPVMPAESFDSRWAALR